MTVFPGPRTHSSVEGCAHNNLEKHPRPGLESDLKQWENWGKVGENWEIVGKYCEILGKGDERLGVQSQKSLGFI